MHLVREYILIEMEFVVIYSVNFIAGFYYFLFGRSNHLSTDFIFVKSVEHYLILTLLQWL